jgi:predicted GNAT family N-acyltransferase
MRVELRLAGPSDLPGALALRLEVFCREQGVPEALERDGHDAAAIHLVAVDDVGRVVATCRLLADGPRMRLGRMAVARAHRGRGIGARLLDLAHREARAAGAREVELHAQLAVRDFYAGAGYAAEGDEFEEAGIRHVLMRRPLA